MLLSCVKIVVARCWQILASGVNLFSCIYLWTEPSPVASHCIHCGLIAHVCMFPGSSLFTSETSTMIVSLRCSMHKEIYRVWFISWWCWHCCRCIACCCGCKVSRLTLCVIVGCWCILGCWCLKYLRPWWCCLGCRCRACCCGCKVSRLSLCVIVGCWCMLVRSASA